MSITPKVHLKLGDKGQDVKNLHKYLKTFGYIKSEVGEITDSRIDLERAIDPPEQQDIFDENTNMALIEFQKFNKLPVTGLLDKRTLDLMETPRCANLDIVQGEKIDDYVIVGSWNRTNLSYRLENLTPDLTNNVISRAITDALNQWINASPINFNQASIGGDIRISWQIGDHGDGYPFDGPSNVLAHAFYPTHGGLHFDDDETWTDNNPPSGIDLVSVAIHELGHSLGLGHSSDPNAVMYAYYNGIRRSLNSDDIAGIQAIYGVRGWASLGGAISSNIAVAINSDGRLQVFARGINNSIVYKTQTAAGSSTWSGWASLGGGTAGDPSVARNSDGRLQVFVRASNNSIVYKTQTAAGSSTWSAGLPLEVQFLVTLLLQLILMEDYKFLLGVLTIQLYINHKQQQEVPGQLGLPLEVAQPVIPP